MTPSTELVDGQSITFAGSGFADDVTLVSVAQVTPAIEVADFGEATVSGGSFSITVPVHRFLGQTDCATLYGGGHCVIAAVNLDGGSAPADEVALDYLWFHVPTYPQAPVARVDATAGNAEATVSWNAPASNGGSPITGYIVTPYVGYYPFPPVTFNTTDTTQVITGRLINGLTYRFRVQAINAFGRSGYSRVTNQVTASTTVAPDLGAPTIIQNATAGTGWSATVSWTAPTTDGGSPITGYVVTPYAWGFPFPAYTFHTIATTQTLTDLFPGVTFRFRVQAINATGTGASSTVTNPVTPTA